MDTDAPDNPPDLDSDTIPNIVLYPGDTLALGGDGNVDRTITLRNARNGQPYAVLDCERNRDGEFIICGIRADRRGMLPVRSQPEPDPHGLTVYDAQPERHPQPVDLDATVAVAGPLDGPYYYVVGHSHHHKHGTGDGDALTHFHKHEHAGADARRANDAGHTADVHDHKH